MTPHKTLVYYRFLWLPRLLWSHHRQRRVLCWGWTPMVRQ